MTLSFSKSSVFKLFFVYDKTPTRCFQIPPVLKSVCEKLRFRDGLVWTVGLTVEIKLRFRDGLVWTVGLTVEIKPRFQMSPAQCGRGGTHGRFPNTA